MIIIIGIIIPATIVLVTVDSSFVLKMVLLLQSSSKI